MNYLYSTRCDCCGGELHDLADDAEEWDNIYTDIAKQLLEGKDLDKDAIYNKTAAQLIAAMNNGFGGTSFDDNDSRIALQKAFTQNLEAFSYAKTLTQFNLFKEAVFNDKGQLQSFATVKKAVADTGEVFNNNYLRAEHQFVTQSAIMAHKWETLDAEYLEFTTVGDRRVRPEHKLFDKFTALKSDPIWRRLYTPLDWGCRCTVIPGISKNVSKEYNSEWANKVVDPLVKGTIFDNNVALTKVIFNDKHPYFKASKTNKLQDNNKLVPKGIENYEEKTGVKINKEIFSFLKKETPFYNISPDKVGTNGAFFHPDKNYVVVPIDKARLRSKWKAESVVYHEFGHASDWQHDLKFKKSVTNLMKKHRAILRSENGYAEVDKKVYALGYKSQMEENWDMVSKCGAISDTIMSLNSNYGQGHSKAYFKIKGMPEAEFLAHAFENKFAGNDVFKKVMPELYEDTIKLIDELKTKLK